MEDLKSMTISTHVECPECGRKILVEVYESPGTVNIECYGCGHNIQVDMELKVVVRSVNE